MSYLTQKTIQESVSFNGIALHSGVNVDVCIKPAQPNFGIVFKRVDLKNNNLVYPNFNNVTNTLLNTTISNEHGVKVSTIEHLMSALSGLHIDNIKIEIDGPEVPIMDGSSIKFVDLIDQTSTQSLNKRRKILKVKKNIKVENNDSSVELKPNNQFSIDFEIKEHVNPNDFKFAKMKPVVGTFCVGNKRVDVTFSELNQIMRTANTAMQACDMAYRMGKWGKAKDR